MAVLTEGQHTGEGIQWEGDPSHSRETVTILSGQNLKALAVVGRISLGVGRASVPTVVGTGNGTMTAVSAGPRVERGNYVVKCTVAIANSGTFSVTTPSGDLLPNATVGTPYVSDHIRFTINDGATDFAVNDTFTIVVGTTVPVVVGTGNGVISAVSLGPEAKSGNYRFVASAVATNAATWTLYDPDGATLGSQSYDGSGGTAVFATPQLNATITDGSTDFAADDTFNVGVFNELSGGKAVAWNPATNDGRHIAVGVAYDNYDATLADVVGVIVTRNAVVRKADLQWGSAITAEQKDSAYSQLAANGVIAR
jgi:hypothetical protein